MNKISVKQIVESNDYHTVLVDASGVLYTDSGVVEGAAEAVDLLQKNGINVFVVTNNSGMNPMDISARFKSKRFDIEVEQVLSSGMGLYLDFEIQSLISGHTVYVYGKPSSHYYIEQAGGVMVEDIDEAEMVVMTASLKGEENRRVYELVKKWIETHRDFPVICANSDFHIWTGQGLYEVCGHYAKQLQKETGVEIVWIGKPTPRFSEVVRGFLKDRSIDTNDEVLFCDDNVKNVRALSKDLGISGALVMETGLANSGEDLIEDLTHEIDFVMDRFSI